MTLEQLKEHILLSLRRCRLAHVSSAASVNGTNVRLRSEAAAKSEANGKLMPSRL